jgi:anti-sigma regulatory factor (Ser/Thr protein kinase)
MAKRHNINELDRFLLRLVSDGASNIAAQAGARFSISRQAVNKRLRAMIGRGVVTATGSTRARQYKLVTTESEARYAIGPDLKEHEIWREFARPQLEGIAPNVISVCQYGFTEMVNNVIDHSEGDFLVCLVVRSALKIQMRVHDNGVGILRKLKQTLNLEDERHAVLELSKGKLTTDPARHTGEGIFFTSRMFDTFSILSGNLLFTYRPDDSDWLLEDKDPIEGTGVWMEIAPDSGRTTKEILDKYTSLGDDYLFAITHIPVGLARYGDENLVSRSQAKRLMARVERFREVVLDFSGVNTIGQAFADEIFRVFHQLHPDVQLRWFNANKEVETMIKRAIAQRDLAQLSVFDDHERKNSDSK